MLSGVGGFLSVIQTLNPPEAEAAEPEPVPNPKACNERDRQFGCRNWDGAAADFSGQIRSDDNYEINLGDKSKKRPVTKCDDRGCWVEYVSVAPVKKPPKPPADRGPSLRDVLRAKQDLQKLQEAGVPKSEHKTILFSKYPADVVNKVMP